MHNQTESRRNFLEIPSPKFINYPMRLVVYKSLKQPELDYGVTIGQQTQNFMFS